MDPIDNNVVIDTVNKLTVDHFIASTPPVILSAIAGIIRAWKSNTEVTTSEMLRQLFISAFAGEVVFMYLYDKNGFSYMTKLAIVSICAFSSRLILASFDGLTKRFIDFITPNEISANKKRNNISSEDEEINSDLDEEYLSPKKITRTINDEDEDIDDTTITFDEEDLRLYKEFIKDRNEKKNNTKTNLDTKVIKRVRRKKNES